MDERKKHGWGRWVAAVAIMLPVLYTASFGPACWATAQTGPLINPPPEWMFIYLPL